jgi:hypothetical protein
MSWLLWDVAPLAGTECGASQTNIVGSGEAQWRATAPFQALCLLQCRWYVTDCTRYLFLLHAVSGT